MNVVLASTSAYRRELLGRLQLPFTCVAPEVDESHRPNESPASLSLRLAKSKAEAVANQIKLSSAPVESPAGSSRIVHVPDTVVIGSDQVLAVGNKIYGKPGDYEAACQQLQHLSGQSVVFYTAIALYCLPSNAVKARIVDTQVKFRTLTDSQIQTYLQREPAFDCAGSAKSEGLGIALLAAIKGDDPTALIGLPLIALCDLLLEVGVSLPLMPDSEQVS